MIPWNTLSRKPRLHGVTGNTLSSKEKLLSNPRKISTEPKSQKQRYSGACWVSGGCTAFAVDVAGICRGCRWHLPRISLAFAEDIAGICRGYRWHLPRTIIKAYMSRKERAEEHSPLLFFRSNQRYFKTCQQMLTVHSHTISSKNRASVE